MLNSKCISGVYFSGAIRKHWDLAFEACAPKSRAYSGGMKKTGICLLWLTLSVLPSFGQVIVEVTLPQDHFLPGEALPVAVRVINRSGQVLRLGEDASWLTFTVQSRDNQIVPKLGEPPVEGAFTLDSSKRA